MSVDFAGVHVTTSELCSIRVYVNMHLHTIYKFMYKYETLDDMMLHYLN